MSPEILSWFCFLTRKTNMRFTHFSSKNTTVTSNHSLKLKFKKLGVVGELKITQQRSEVISKPKQTENISVFLNNYFKCLSNTKTIISSKNSTSNSKLNFIDNVNNDSKQELKTKN